MNNSDEFKKPSGYIGIVLHKGGEYDNQTDSIIGGELLEKTEFKNLIVNTASILMAQRLAPGASTGENSNTGTNIEDGLQYLAVGTIADPVTRQYTDSDGVVQTIDWMNPPVATVEQEKLVREIARKEFTSWTFLDSSGNATGNPTNVLRLATTFEEGEAVGALTEMGLFGGNATDDPDSGKMFNYKTFAVNKQAA